MTLAPRIGTAKSLHFGRMHMGPGKLSLNDTSEDEWLHMFSRMAVNFRCLSGILEMLWILCSSHPQSVPASTYDLSSKWSRKSVVDAGCFGFY